MSEPNAEQPQDLTVPAVWVGLEDVPISFANQFIGQMDDRCEVVLSLGQVLAPVLMGTAEQQQQQAQNIPFVQVKPIARVSLSTARIRELVDVLQSTLQNQERCQQARKAIEP
jgi:hypothetical protein